MARSFCQTYTQFDTLNVDRMYDYNCHENSSLEITLRKDNTCTVIQDLTVTKVSYRNTMKITYEGCLCERVRVESHAINLVRLIKYVAPTNLHGRIDGCTHERPRRSRWVHRIARVERATCSGRGRGRKMRETKMIGR